MEMKVAIDIPKYVYDMTLANGYVIDADVEKVGQAIIKGIILPENERLISAEQLKKDNMDMVHGHYFGLISEFDVDNAPTVV